MSNKYTGIVLVLIAVLISHYIIFQLGVQSGKAQESLEASKAVNEITFHCLDTIEKYSAKKPVSEFRGTGGNGGGF